MYMSGSLTIDPSKLSHIRRKPTKGFRRIAEILTIGLIAEHEVHQTFSALSILQQVNSVLRSLGITDVVRFTKDDEVVYEDPDSNDTDDMRLVLDRIAKDSRSLSSTIFSRMSLLVEHHLPEITLVIEVRIQRTHAIGQYPIQIIVNGLASSFSEEEAGTATEKMNQSFEDQLGYNAFTDHFREQFDDFLQELEDAVGRHMQVDKVHRSSEAKILRPSQPSDGTTRNTTAAFSAGGDSAPSQHSDPVFQRYDSTSDAFAYCWMWSTFMNLHDIQPQDVTIVDERGGEVGVVDSEGQEHDSAGSYDSAFAGSDESSRNIADTDTGSGFSSWLSSFGGFDGSDSSGGGDSSCGGSSCGGGCGGD